MTKTQAQPKPQAPAEDHRAAEAAASPCQPAEPAQITGKLGLIVGLLRRPEGADLSDMMEATGWQQHSVRGALAGALKKKRGLNIVSDKPGNVRVYRISEPVVVPRRKATRAVTEDEAPTASQIEVGAAGPDETAQSVVMTAGADGTASGSAKPRVWARRSKAISPRASLRRRAAK
jgi:hypothetical protein